MLKVFVVLIFQLQYGQAPGALLVFSLLQDVPRAKYSRLQCYGCQKYSHQSDTTSGGVDKVQDVCM